MRFVPLLLALIATVVHGAPDYAREQRWADEIIPSLVVGESVTQAAQFVETGGADLGFVALSTVLAPALKTKGRWLEVPAELHAPLAHAAILTTRGASNAQAPRATRCRLAQTARRASRARPPRT